MMGTRPTGMRAFTVVWLGQVISLLGTSMTQFAITIWAWEFVTQIQPVPDPATAMALVGFFNFAPLVLFSPIAGALVDRWNRKLVMMLSDLAAGAATIAIFLLYSAGQLQIWHLYVAGAFTGLFQSFQFPAYSAAISTMIPKEQYTRADAMLGLAESFSGIAAPVIAVALLAIIDIRGILLLDIVTFVAAIGALLIVHIPQPEVSAIGKTSKGSLWQESLFGFSYILRRPSLLGMQLIFFGGNLVGSMAFAIMAPMILSRTSNSEATLAAVQAAGGIGGVIGGLLLTAWGGPKRKAYGVLLGHVGVGLLGTAVLGLGRGLIVWAGAAFLSWFFIPLINGSNQALWQTKVVPDVQGRVFAVRRMIAQISGPLGILLAGPLADKVFEPAMQPGGALVSSFGWLTGSGPGAGMALMFVWCGLLTALVGLAGLAIPVVRRADTILPDHDAGVIQTGTEMAEATAAVS